jgi:mono/diheme cytochrome c family protein
MLAVCLFASLARANSPVPERMATHAELTEAASKAVIHADLEGVAGAARQLAALPLEGVAPALRPGLKSLRQAARALEGAPDPRQAALALAELGATCAACHDATRGGPALNLRSVPPAEYAADHAMPRHRWAVDWLWLGLITPSEEAWQRGAKALGGLPLFPEAGPRPEGVAELAAQVERLGREALTATEPGARRRVYGELLGSCASCHVKLEGQADTPR